MVLFSLSLSIRNNFLGKSKLNNSETSLQNNKRELLRWTKILRGLLPHRDQTNDQVDAAQCQNPRSNEHGLCSTRTEINGGRPR